MTQVVCQAEADTGIEDFGVYSIMKIVVFSAEFQNFNKLKFEELD